jgi:autotransporter translocation and assembly factor TamB
MEATRITRKPRPEAKTQEQIPTVVVRAPPRPPEPARPPPPSSLPLERIALVALVFGKGRAKELLDGLGESEARQAKTHLAGFEALSSARRQARVAVEFGVRPDAAVRLKAVMEEAPEVLRRELFRRLPPYHRSLFPERQAEPPDAAATPAVCALAERLIREATR